MQCLAHVFAWQASCKLGTAFGVAYLISSGDAACAGYHRADVRFLRDVHEDCEQPANCVACSLRPSCPCDPRLRAMRGVLAEPAGTHVPDVATLLVHLPKGALKSSSHVSEVSCGEAGSGATALGALLFSSSLWWIAHVSCIHTRRRACGSPNCGQSDHAALWYRIFKLLVPLACVAVDWSLRHDANWRCDVARLCPLLHIAPFETDLRSTSLPVYGIMLYVSRYSACTVRMDAEADASRDRRCTC